MSRRRKVALAIVFLSAALVLTNRRDVYCELAPPTLGSPLWTFSEDSWSYWWSYSGVSGPAYWGLLNLDWSICDKGRRQSPIDIETARLMFDPQLGPLHTDSNLISGLFYNDGHALVFNASAYVTTSTATTLGTTQITSTRNSTRRRRHQQLSSGDSDPRASSIFNQALMSLEASASNANEQKPDLAAPGLLKELEESVKLSIGRQAPDLREGSSGGQDTGDQEQLPGASGGGAGGASAEGQTQLAEDSLPQLPRVHFTGAGLAYPFRFETMSLRFSLEDKLGSEHLINSQAYAAELQLFAYNSMLYKSFAEASTKPHGLLAIAILVDILPDDNNNNNGTTARTNAQLDSLLVRLNELKHRGSSIPVANLNLSSLLPEMDHFIAYEGSLTTPGCHESVNWLILNKPLYITRTNLDHLRSISADEQTNTPSTGTLIAGNIRPLQLANGRPVRTNIRPITRGGQNPETCQRLWTRYDYRPIRRR